MEYRPLGKTGLKVSVIGLGVEHLLAYPEGQPRENAHEIIREAVENGVNYFDLVWSLPPLMKRIAEGIQEKRSKVHLAVHLGSCYEEGKYKQSRNLRSCEETFRETLENLGVNRASFINLHYVSNLKQWKLITKPGGVLDLAIRLRDEGLGRVVAISTHDMKVIELAAEHPEIKSVMFQVNMANHNLPGRDSVLKYCEDQGVGLVAMKPYAAGRLLQRDRTVSIAAYQTGGVSLRTKIPSSLTPVKCLDYALSQPGVCTTVPGVSTIEELMISLDYCSSSKEEKEYEEELRQLHS